MLAGCVAAVAALVLLTDVSVVPAATGRRGR